MNTTSISIIFLIITAFTVSGCGGASSDSKSMGQAISENEQKLIDAVESKKSFYSQYHPETSPPDLTGTWIAYEAYVNSDGELNEKSYTTKIKHNVLTGEVLIFNWSYEPGIDFGYYNQWGITYRAILTEDANFDFNDMSQFDDNPCCDDYHGPIMMRLSV